MTACKPDIADSADFALNASSAGSAGFVLSAVNAPMAGNADVVSNFGIAGKANRGQALLRVANQSPARE